MKQIQIPSLRPLRIQIHFRIRKAVLKIPGTKDQRALPVVPRRIHHFERHVRIAFRGKIKAPGVVVGSLVGPAAFSVPGNLVRVSHIHLPGEVKRDVENLHLEIPEQNAPRPLLDAQTEIHFAAIGGDGELE